MVQIERRLKCRKRSPQGYQVVIRTATDPDSTRDDLVVLVQFGSWQTAFLELVIEKRERDRSPSTAQAANREALEGSEPVSVLRCESIAIPEHELSGWNDLRPRAQFRERHTLELFAEEVAMLLRVSATNLQVRRAWDETCVGRILMTHVQHDDGPP
jgi:hypothetical protein